MLVLSRAKVVNSQLEVEVKDGRLSTIHNRLKSHFAVGEAQSRLQPMGSQSESDTTNINTSQ